MQILIFISQDLQLNHLFCTLETIEFQDCKYQNLYQWPTHYTFPKSLLRKIK